MTHTPNRTTRSATPRRERPTPRAQPGPRWRLALLAVFVGTLVWRLLAVARLADSPLMGELTADSAVYWAWAGEIRSGAWWGQQAFFLSALYPYVLALWRELWADSMRAVLSTQCVISALAVTALTDATRRLTSEGIALGIATLLALLTMGTFFDLLILMESLLFALSAALLWLVVAWPWLRRPMLGALLVGACIGLSAQGRATHALLLLPFIGFLFATLQRPGAWRATLVTLAVIITLALPTTIRHLVLVHEWIPYTYSLGYNAYVGNGPEANGSFVLITGSVESEDPVSGSSEGGTGSDGRSYQRQHDGLDFTPAQSSRHWLAQTLAFAQREPQVVMRLLLRKLALLVNHREVPQIENVAVHERVLGPLGPPGLGSFIPLGVLGLAGLVLALRRGPRERFVVGMLLTLAVSTAAFFVTDRYRHQLMPTFALLTGITLWSAWQHWRSSNRRALTGVVASIVVAASLTALPLVPFDPNRLAWETYSALGAALLRRGDAQAAVLTLGQAVALDDAGKLPGADWATAKVMRAAVHENLAIAQRMAGDLNAALRSYRRAAELAPDARSLHANYGQVAAMLQLPDEARAALAVARLQPPQAAAELFHAANIAQSRSDTLGLEAALRGVITLQPGDERSRVALVRTLIQRGRFNEAALELARAASAGLDVNVHAAHQALLAATRGDTTAAASWRARLSPQALQDSRIAATLQMLPR